LSAFTTVHKGLPDMYLMHVDETHFDLMIRKDSYLAKEGSVDEMLTDKNQEKEEEVPNDDIGPGYMGWAVNDAEEPKSTESIDFNTQVKELKDAYNTMKKDFEELKLDVSRKDKKEFSKLREEINGLKEDYKKGFEDLKTETHARNKAETLVKVLKDTLEAKTELEERKKNDDMDVDISRVEVASDDDEWKHQRQQKKNMKKRARGKSGDNQDQLIFGCDICKSGFESKPALNEHVKTHTQFNCIECQKIFKDKSELKEHMKTHEQKIFACVKCVLVFPKESDLRTHKHEIYTCEQCDNKYELKNDLEKHVLTHVQKEFICNICEQRFAQQESFVKHKKEHEQMPSSDDYKCKKCEKTYSSMGNLRRHDWRSHRNIECTICSEMLESRQEISMHRENKHNMYRKIACKYYPECFDGDECLYVHNSALGGNQPSSLCPRGQNCSDQCCTFSEQNHRTQKSSMCRYQQNCNRSGCQFLHVSARKSFLGGSPSTLRGK
jgi:hypothetical protein